MKAKPAEACPCGRARSYADCCGRLHAGDPSGDAESLMRSRYSAYAKGLEEYLLATWHATTRPVELDLTNAPQPKWLGLEVKASAESGDQATVEFVAICRIGGRAQRMHEVSRFLREQGRWYYFDGITD
jgi:SEC-C motif-containing protein